MTIGDGRRWLSPLRRLISPDRPSRLSQLAFVTLLAVIVAHFFGLIGPSAFPIVTVSSILCASLGVQLYSPKPQWPWWALTSSGMFWTVSGILRTTTESTGNLTATRSLLPDVFALPGYAMFAVGLYGLLRQRSGERQPGRILDTMMLGLGSLLIVFELIVTPTADVPNAYPPAQFAVAVYPMVSLLMIVLTARLAFGSGRNSASFRLLLFSAASLFVGDLIYALAEIGSITATAGVIEIPYLLTGAFASAAALDPSMRSIGAHRRTFKTLGTGRLIAVGGALLAPIVVIATQSHEAAGLIAGVLCLALAIAAILRLGRAMRAQATQQARFAYQATHDSLTGLPGRMVIADYVDERLGLATYRPHPIAVLLIDIDGFRLINDSLGQAIGDALLISVGRRVQSTIGLDGLVGRTSGDEFVVVVDDVDGRGAQHLADVLRTVLAEPFTTAAAGDVYIAASIGVTVAYAGENTSSAILLQEADTAMYGAKDQGRDTVVMFDHSMRESVKRRLALESRVRLAMQQGEFKAHFQPIVDLTDGGIVGFEALARWNPDDLDVTPTEFIKAAEDSGLIVPLGAFMLDEACRVLAELREVIPGTSQLTMSVNLSPRQIRDGEIVDTVAETLERHRLPGRALWLEITESVIMEDSVMTASVLAGIRALGVRLSVDDFGTGYSSLSYLKSFPVSRVKIDKSFIGGTNDLAADSRLIAAIIGMAAALELDVVAEGVETREHAELLRRLGCQKGQGHLYQSATEAALLGQVIERLGIGR